MSTLNDNDLFVYQEAATGDVGSVANNNRSNLDKEDLFVVYRPSTGLNYKVKASDVGLNNIEVSKGVISPTSGVEEGDTLTGTATVTGNVDPTVYIHKWYVNGVQSTSATTNTFTAREGQVTYQMCVTDPNNTTPVCGAVSDAVTVGPATKPTATMYGLRFDSNRSTQLLRTLNTGNGSGTFSAWLKRTGDDQSWTIDLSTGLARVGIKLIDGSNIYLYGGATTNIGVTLEDNIWTHLVISYEKDGDLKLYKNGTLVNTQPLTADMSSDTLKVGLGGTNLGASSYNGYMSDVYFVDGAVLPPETFAKDFDAGWGPLDSSVVLDNIGAKTSPYNTRPNMDEKWSDGGLVISTWENAFNNSLSAPSAYAANGVSAPINFNPPLSGVIEVYASNGSNSATDATGSDLVTLSDGSELDVSGTIFPNAKWHSFGAKTNITSLQLTGGGTQGTSLFAIRVDGRVLVDGPADNSQVWSNNLTVSTAFQDGYGPDKVFDNNGTTFAACGAGAATFTLSNVSIGKAGDTLAIKAVNSNDFSVPASNAVSVNGSPAFFTTSGQEIFIALAEPLTSLSIDLTDSPRFYHIKNNGKLLVDAPSAPWDTSQVWSDNLVLSNPDASYADTTKSFDGDLTTRSGSITTTSNGDSQTITHTCTAIPCTSLRIHARLNTNATGSIVAAGQTVNLDSDNTDKWYTFTGPFSDYEGLTATVTNTSSLAAGVFIHAIEVNGKILVDAGSFGDNGFYLPFNPSATGQVWSDNFSVAGGAIDIGTPINAFDGDPTTQCGTGTSSAIVRFDISDNPIPITESLVIRTDGKYGDRIITLNDNSSAQITAISGTPTNYTVPLAGETELQKIESNGAVGIYQIIVDGKILIDHSSIGNDASGQGNNFQDENFAAGNTSQVWSSGGNDSELSNGSWSNVFNSFDADSTVNTTAEISAYVAGSSPSYTFPGGPVTGRLTFVLNGGGTNPSTGSIRLSDGQLVQKVATADQRPAIDVDVTSVTGFELNAPEQIDGTALYAVFLNGVQLVDANIQDTVKDTPMRNYAVMTGPGASNGNLHLENVTNSAYKSTSITLSGYGTIYFEATQLSGSAGGSHIGVSNGAGNTLNVNSNGGNGGASLVSGDPAVWSVGETIGVILNAGGREMTINNPTAGTTSNLQFAGAQPSWSPLSACEDGIQVTNFGQQPFAYATDNGDGTVTLKNTAPNYDEKWSDYIVALNSADQDIGFVAGRGADKAFNGVTGEGGVDASEGANAAPVGVGTQIIFTPPSSIPVTSYVDIWAWANVNCTYTITTDQGTFTATGTQSTGNSKTRISCNGSISEIKSVSQGDNTAIVHSINAISVDGRVLIDGPADNSQEWSSSITNNRSPASSGFDGNVNTEVTADTELKWNPTLTGVTRFEIRCRVSQGGGGSLNVSGNGIVSTNISANNVNQYINIPLFGDSGNIDNVVITTTDSGSLAPGIAAIKVNDKILVDGMDTGPFKTLSQTWSQWVTATTRELLARSESRVDALEQVILAQAVDWSYGATYQTDDLVKFNCSVWRAKSDGITTRTPILTNADIWENLEIDCERTHTMDDLIPDDWSQEQRRAALQELLLELSEDEPEGY